MAFQTLKAYLRTAEPYRSNFSERMLLHKVPLLDTVYKAWLGRPWIKRRPTPITNLKAGCYIGAIPHYRTGIGHILAEWNTGLLWSKQLGLPFAHCPLRQPWNNFLGLTDFPDFEAARRTPGLRYVQLPPISDNENPVDSFVITSIINHYGQKAPTLFYLYYGQNSFRQDETSEILRAKYFARRKADPMPSVRKQGLINVSVHVRRRNLEDLSNPRVHDTNSAFYKSRYLGNDFFLSACHAIESSLGPNRTVFNVFSQGKPDEFKAFDVLRNVRFFLDTDVLETFHNLVIGDILIVSPSSFSFKAGMISPGLKIASHPWWHYVPENSKWCRIGTDPTHDEERVSAFVTAGLSYG